MSAAPELRLGARVSADPGPREGYFDSRRPLAAEMGTRVTDGFTLAATGDLIISRPMFQYRATQPTFGALLDVLTQSSVVYGNLETVAFDPRTLAAAPYSWEGDWPLRSDPEAIADLKAMGFGLLSRANNHALDWGIDGLRETDRHLDRHGLTHAGSGETLALARQARFRETTGGRVGLVSCTTTYRDTTNALDPCGGSAGRPGVSALALTRRLSLPPALHGKLEPVEVELRKAGITDALPPLEAGAAESPFYRSEPNPVQLAAILKEVRQGKQSSDLLLVALHAHEATASWNPERVDWTPEVPDEFVVQFGRQAIDAGADAVVVTGLHHLGPVVLHDGRPILTGIGNFFWSDLQSPLPADLYERNASRLAEAFKHPERATEADLTLLLNASSFAHEESFLSVVAQMQFGTGGLRSLVLHPVDLGYGDPLSLSGLPRLARPDTAEKIFRRLTSISAPYGTELSVRPDPARDTLVAHIVL